MGSMWVFYIQVPPLNLSPLLDRKPLGQYLPFNYLQSVRQLLSEICSHTALAKDSPIVF